MVQRLTASPQQGFGRRGEDMLSLPVGPGAYHSSAVLRPALLFDDDVAQLGPAALDADDVEALAA